MRPSEHPPPPGDAPPGGLRPLTKVRKDGKPYARYADVEAEIRHVLATDPPGWSPVGLKSETLVYLVRELRWNPERDDVLGRLVNQLGRRAGVIARDYTGRYPQAVRNEIEETVESKVVELLFALRPSTKSENLEVNFRTTVECLVLNEIRRNKRNPRPRQFAPLGDSAEGEPESQDQGDAIPDTQPGPSELAEVRDLLRRGLDAITDPRHREAVILRYEKGWQVGDGDQTETISYQLDVSRRQIQEWIRAAVAQMRQALGENP
ncbi:MAG: hypothetical protein U0804_01465 [Gemmataceae bacterium]